MDENSELTRLALAKFTTLTAGEKTLLENLHTGNPTIFKDDEERTIRAEVIAWLCKNKNAIAQVSNNVLEIYGAKISGKLDLKFVDIPFAFGFFKCSFNDVINLQNAKITCLNLEETDTYSIHADGIKVERSVFLRNGFQSYGEVHLHGATIGGDLNCLNGLFKNEKKDGYALFADSIKVEGSIILRDEFISHGEVRLHGATIRGDLDCLNGQFENENGKALVADGITVEGNIILRDEFTSHGEVRLHGATIGGNLDCEKGHFINDNGKALIADGITVDGDVFLRNDFKSYGEVRLPGATIGGDLDCTDGHFENEKKDGKALHAEGIKVEGNAYFRNGFSANGKVSFATAKFDKGFIWTNVKDPKKTKLDLRQAYIGTLWDDEKSLPNHENLFLQGLEYSSINYKAPHSAKQRKEWIRRQYPENPKVWKYDNYNPQPYQQLASVLRKQGHEKDAKDILIAKVKDQIRFEQNNMQKEISESKRTKDEFILRLQLLGYNFKYSLFSLIDYGYNPLNALKIGMWIILLGCVFFGLGSHFDLITPSQGIDTFIVVPPNNGEPLSSAYPKFNVIAYSFDVFLPIIDLHQQKYFLPNANINPFCSQEFWGAWGGLLRFWMWIQIIAGWVLTTLFLGGITGLIRK